MNEQCLIPEIDYRDETKKEVGDKMSVVSRQVCFESYESECCSPPGGINQHQEDVNQLLLRNHHLQQQLNEARNTIEILESKLLAYSNLLNHQNILHEHELKPSQLKNEHGAVNSPQGEVHRMEPSCLNTKAPLSGITSRRSQGTQSLMQRYY